jgi:protein-tyrosine phosphatase
LEHGVDGSAHRARQLTTSMLRDAGLVVTMERGHVATLARMAPEMSGKVVLLDRWLLRRDIPDPHRQHREAYEHVYAMIEAGVREWLPYL